MTKDLGQSNFKYLTTVNPTSIQRILINRPNQRLGNLLMVTPLIDEIERNFPNAKVDVFVKGTLAPTIFKAFPNVDTFIRLPKKPFKEFVEYSKMWFSIRKKKYDFVINIDACSSSGRLATKVSRARFKFFGDLPNGVSILEPHMAKFPVVYFRKCMELIGVEVKKEKIPELNLRLSTDELSHGKILLEKLRGDKKNVIAIFTFATGEKNHGVIWWRKFYDLLKLAFPDSLILEILPAHNESAIAFEAKEFLSQDIRELGAVLHHCNVFIGADSGIMHLASAAKVPIIGLFNSNNIARYLPYGNSNIAVDTRAVSTKEIIELIKERL
ncbi:glycosyltransferase family 9 protein [Flavobacterium ichthyis]|uniref:glycosyltransferase family 9 protein n=1 Tax=Flavobacterium ichthyis TaxID=2698827 RepID=UPI001AA19F8B|nr:glycosyltransferase family 9 protein [Flavobacterium ichthyis]